MAGEIDPQLTDDERHLLVHGLYEWGGPAKPTKQIANLLGFADVQSLFDDGGLIARRIRSGDPLTPADWRRALLATEIVFASDLVGSGVDWSITTGIPDEAAVRLLRSVQRKLVRIARSA
jgi:hypothetical protein